VVPLSLNEADSSKGGFSRAKQQLLQLLRALHFALTPASNHSD